MPRILVVKLSALGDLFHAVPVVHALREHFGMPIDWVTQPEYAALAACHRDVDRVISYPRRGGSWRTFLRELRREQYDIAVDLQGLFKSGVVLGACRAKRKIAFSMPREGSSCFANERPKPAGQGTHALDRLNDTLRHLGIEPGVPEYPLNFPETPLLPGDAPRLGIAPKSRWPAKDWPLESFAEAAKALRREQPGLGIYIFGGPGDKEAGETLVQEIGAPVWNLCGQHPLLALGPQLAQMNALLCNDSGPMHFAAAVGTPVVALFGPTDPALTGPVGPQHRVLRPPPGPDGYPSHRSYKEPGNAFIATLPVEEAVEALRSLIVGTPRA